MASCGWCGESQTTFDHVSSCRTDKGWVSIYAGLKEGLQQLSQTKPEARRPRDTWHFHLQFDYFIDGPFNSDILTLLQHIADVIHADGGDNVKAWETWTYE